MSEWQPVRISSKAPHVGPGWTDYHRLDGGKIVRVRPVEMSVALLLDMRLGGCDGTQAYLVHPEDAKILSDPSTMNMMVCEHQILAD